MKKKVKVSYVKKPFAKRSFIAAGLSVCSLALFLVGMAHGIQSNGQIPLNVAAACFCSLLLAAASVLYGALSFLEKEKKYLLSKASLVVSGLLVAFWLVLIIIGSKG